jgi:hypothetical protein
MVELVQFVTGYRRFKNILVLEFSDAKTAKFAEETIEQMQRELMR